MVLRKLASTLAHDGFHVLRFDYYGTGDSSGGPRDGSLSEWCQNIVTAAADLKECSGVTKVSLLGLRLGATLAALTPMDVTNLVLWDPVVDGRKYLDELRSIHTRKFSSLLYPPRLPARGRGGELLGFPLEAQRLHITDYPMPFGRSTNKQCFYRPRSCRSWPPLSQGGLIDGTGAHLRLSRRARRDRD
jgi:pimeloyl-ACP methyl ester carboxylesterase